MDIETILQQENLDLKARLKELEETLEAICKGKVDAIVVKGEKGDQIYSLISPEHPYKIFIDKMLEAAIIVSKEGTLLYGNQSFFDMIDIPSEKIIGASIVDFVEEEQKSYFIEKLQKEERKRSELTLLNSKQKKINVTFSISKGIWGDSENLCILISDISALKKALRFIQASENIAKSLSGTPSILSAARELLNELNSCLNWEIIALWSWSKQQEHLACLEVAYISDINAEEFAKKTKLMQASKGSIPDRVWTSYHPIAVENITEDFTFSRRKEAMAAGLQGALSFPIYENKKLTGIVELFRRLPFQETIDDTLQTLLTSTGIDIGLYLQRKFEEEVNSQFLQLIQYSSNGIYQVDKQGIIKSWNPAAEIIYGWTSEEIVGNDISKIYPLEQKNAFAEILKILPSKKTIQHLQTSQMHKDGTLLSMSNTYGVICDSLGELVEIYVIAEDISYKVRDKEILQDMKERFEAFIDITEDWIWEIDKAGNFIFSNHAVEKILGYETEEVLEKNILSFLSEENIKTVQKEFEKNIIEKKGWQQKVMHFIHKNGSDRWIETNAIPMLNSNNILVGYRGASRDTTSARSIEKIKNEFISMVSHEMRTPLTSIHGALILLQAPESTIQENHNLLNLAIRNSERLIHLINDVMDVQKMQLGELHYVFEKINLCEVLSEAINSSNIVAKKFDVSIVTEGFVKDAEVYGDYQRLIQVILNLLSNAIKFTPSHGIVKVALQNLENAFKVSISDQGPGIPKEFESKLFEKFAQADSSSKREYGGTGLGLSISQNIIEAHKGKIHYFTKIGEGTTFFFELPKYKGG